MAISQAMVFGLSTLKRRRSKACFKWVVKPKRLMHVLLSPFVDMGAIHSEVMINGYAALNKYLEKGTKIRTIIDLRLRWSIWLENGPILTGSGIRVSICSAPRRARLSTWPAFFTKTAILSSSAAVNSFSAKAIGHMAPSSRFAMSLNPNVMYRSLNFSPLRKKHGPCRHLRTRASLPDSRREGWRIGFDDGMKPLAHITIGFWHRGILGESGTFPVCLFRTWAGLLLTWGSLLCSLFHNSPVDSHSHRILINHSVWVE